MELADGIMTRSAFKRFKLWEEPAETGVLVTSDSYKSSTEKAGGTRDFRHDPVKACRDIIKGRRDRSEFDIRCANCNILYEYERKSRGVLVR